MREKVEYLCTEYPMPTQTEYWSSRYTSPRNTRKNGRPTNTKGRQVEPLKIPIEVYKSITDYFLKEHAPTKKLHSTGTIHYIKTGMSMVTSMNRMRESVHGSTATYTIEQNDFESYEPAKDKSYMIKKGIKDQIMSLSNRIRPTPASSLHHPVQPKLSAYQLALKKKREQESERREILAGILNDRRENPVTKSRQNHSSKVEHSSTSKAKQYMAEQLAYRAEQIARFRTEHPLRKPKNTAVKNPLLGGKRFRLKTRKKRFVHTA